MTKAAITLATLGACVGIAGASDPFIGPGQYPEFRNLSGLPGGGFGINQDGVPTINGAFALSTPISFSLAPQRFALAAGAMSYDLRFRLPNFESGQGDRANDANGTALGMFGQRIAGTVDITVGGMILSGQGDTVLNLHFAPSHWHGPVYVGAGVQDVFGGGGSAGDGQPGDTDRSTSAYLVATGVLKSRVYLSAGFGTRRFRQGFGSASVGVGKMGRFWAEHDGYSFNYGIAYQLGLFTANLGVIRSKYLVYSLALSF